MAVETSSGRDRSSQSSTSKAPKSAEALSVKKGGLLPGERIVSELKSSGGGSFRLTHARVVFSGGAESNNVYGSTQLGDIASVQISRRPRARRSAAWGVVGLFAAICVWQVTPSSTVGISAALAVAIISLILMADYWIRPAGVHLQFQTTGGATIGGETDGKVGLAMEFAREVEDAKRRLVPRRIKTPYRNYPAG